MTDEEWDSSWEYFFNLFEEANIKLEYVQKIIKEAFLNTEEKENGYEWIFDFIRQKIYIWNPKEEDFKWHRDESKTEQYSEFLSRIYNIPIEKLNGKNDLSYMAKETTFQVTEDCNMACTYCYQHNKKPNVMSFDVAKTYIDILLDNDPKINTYYDSEKMIGAIFDFIGGEPWLQIDLITQISNYIITELFRRKHKWAIRFMFSVCSNGLLHYDPRVQEYLKKHKIHLSYNVSIDGHKKLHDACRLDKCGKGTYDRAFSAAMQWKNEIGGYPTNKMTVSPFNVSELFDALIHMINSGYKHINVNCVMEEGWEKTHATELYWQLHKLTDYLNDNNLLNEVNFSIFDEKKGRPASEGDNPEANPCGGTGNMLAIDWKGNIYPCLRYMENSIPTELREPFIIGNVYDGVNVLPKHQKKVNLLKNITRRSQTTDECYYCPIASLCPNCNGYAYEANGTPDKRTTFICDIAKAEALANYYYFKVKGKPVTMYCPKEWAIEIIGEEEYNKLINVGGESDDCLC